MADRAQREAEANADKVLAIREKVALAAEAAAAVAWSKVRGHSKMAPSSSSGGSSDWASSRNDGRRRRRLDNKERGSGKGNKKNRRKLLGGQTPKTFREKSFRGRQQGAGGDRGQKGSSSSYNKWDNTFTPMQNGFGQSSSSSSSSSFGSSSYDKNNNNNGEAISHGDGHLRSEAERAEAEARTARNAVVRPKPQVRVVVERWGGREAHGV
jgi:hypothetical protein